jgi:hypothetical protein
MMAEWLGEAAIGRRIERAVAAVIEDGRVRTYDMGGSAGTQDMAEAVAGAVKHVGVAVRHTRHTATEEHRPTEEQISMRAALPQRIDAHGSKIEELAGTGIHDAKGG